MAGTRSHSRSGQFPPFSASNSSRNETQSGAADHTIDTNAVFDALEDAFLAWDKSKRAFEKTKKDIEAGEKRWHEEQRRARVEKEEKERRQKEAQAQAEKQKQKELERKRREAEAEARAMAMSAAPPSTNRDYSYTGSVYRAPSITAASTSARTQVSLPKKSVRIYWDISKEDERVADTIRSLMSKLKPQPERYTKGTQLPTRGAVLFGFVWIVSRADIADEDATMLWQNQDAYTALTVCYANPGNEAFLRPPNYVGLREGMIHFSRGKHGDLIRASWILSGAKPEFESDEDADNRGRRIGVEVLGEGKLLRKLQALANQAAQ